MVSKFVRLTILTLGICMPLFSFAYVTVDTVNKQFTVSSGSVYFVTSNPPPVGDACGTGSPHFGEYTAGTYNIFDYWDGYPDKNCTVLFSFYESYTTSPLLLQFTVYSVGQASDGSNLTVYEGGSLYYENTITRIVELLPENGTTTPITSVRVIDGVEVQGATTTISGTFYINPDDISFISGFRVWVQNVDQNWVYFFSALSPYTRIVEESNIEAGFTTISYDVWLPYGGYAVFGKISAALLGVISNPLAIFDNISASQDQSNPLYQYHQYAVGGQTLISGVRQNRNNVLEGILSATSTASTTVTVADCGFGSFDFSKCITFVLIPSLDDLKGIGTQISENVLSKFPLGYVWSIYQILLSSTTASSLGIHAVVPEGVAGTGAQIDLTLSSTTLDYILNATTSGFMNVSAPSSETLYDITVWYWKVFVYLLLGMYIFVRILGSGFLFKIT